MAEFVKSPPAPYIVVIDKTNNYESLMKENAFLFHKQEKEIKKESRKPDSAIKRLILDISGVVLLYTGTFLVCDLLQATKTGEWVKMDGLFLNPVKWLWKEFKDLLVNLKIRYISHKIEKLGCDGIYDKQIQYCNIHNPIDYIGLWLNENIIIPANQQFGFSVDPIDVSNLQKCYQQAQSTYSACELAEAQANWQNKYNEANDCQKAALDDAKSCMDKENEIEKLLCMQDSFVEYQFCN